MILQKKRKHVDDIHDYFKANKRLKSSVQYKDHLPGTMLNEPVLGMIMFNSCHRQDFITIKDLKDFSNTMLYTVQEIFFRRHQGPGLDDHARTFSSLLLTEVDKRNLNPLKQIRVIEQLRHLFSGTESEEGLWKELQFSLVDNSKLNVLNISYKEYHVSCDKTPFQKKRILGVDQLTEDPSSSGQKDLVFVKSSTDNTKVSIPGVERLWLSRAEGFILPNHDTGRILPAESQRNTTDSLVVVTDSSATEYNSADESLVCSTPLPLLKKVVCL
ncbi:hypothetical protein Tco_0539347 [Tanacetum coccineum]